MISRIPGFGRFLVIFCALGWPVMASAHPVTLAFGVHSATDQSITLRTYHAATGELLDTTQLSLVIHDHPSHTPLVVIGSTGWDAFDPSLLVVHVYDAISGAYQWTSRLHLATDEHDQPIRLVHSELAPPVSLHPITFILRARDPQTHTLVWEARVGRRPSRSLAAHIAAGQTFPPTALDCQIVQTDRPGQPPNWIDVFEPLLVLPDDSHDASDEPLPFVPIRHQFAHL